MPFSYNPFSGGLDKVSVDTTIVSGIATHDMLSHLDYASSGHTGFQPAGSYTTTSQLTTASGDIVSQIPSLTGYATETWTNTNFIDNSEAATISGNIVSQIPTNFNTLYYTKGQTDTISGTINTKLDIHKTSSDHDSRYFTEAEITTISGNIISQIPAAYTNEMAQDAVGNIMSGAGSVTVSYNDGDGVITISGLSTGGGLSNVVEDTSPELGGDLDFHAYTISGTGHIVTGAHSTVSGSYEVVNVMYGTGDPTVSGLPDGTLYIQYIA